MNIVQAGCELLQKKKTSSTSTHALVTDGGCGGSSGRGRAGGKRGGKIGCRGGGVTTTAAAVQARNKRRKRRCRRGREAAGQGANVLYLPWSRSLRPRLHGEAVQSVPWERSPRKQPPVSGEYYVESVLAIEVPHPGDDAIAAASFVATEVDGSGAAVYGHLHGAPVASGESVGGGFIGGEEGLALALRAGEGRKSFEAWCFHSGSSGNMSHSCERMTDFRPCNQLVRAAYGTHLPIEGHGNLVEFQSGQNSDKTTLTLVITNTSLSISSLESRCFFLWSERNLVLLGRY